ncbi:hypothetical protein CRG98_025463 [Punica granatum]|uniref:Uncharacterized protein n=1 Tax=Punica granatum TaxID=22663 RepID=A0A2I0JD40_PUNGR|nr:hypothetical protein CRG98_025463 [Punica granatum]
MDAGDSSGRRRCFAVVDRDLTGAKSVEIGGLSQFSGDGSRNLRSPNSPKRELIVRFRSLGLILPYPNSIFVYLIPISSPFEISADLEKIAENRDLGAVPGLRGSRAAGERCPAPARISFFFFK